MVNLSGLSHDYGLPIYKNESIFIGEDKTYKEDVLYYLKSFSPSWITSAKVVDMVTNEKTDKCDSSFFDGKYEWSETDIYHFEKYNMPLNDSFVKFVLSNNNQ